MGTGLLRAFKIGRPSPAGIVIAEGLFPGLGNEFKFGYNADISTDEETVWDEGGIYTYPAAATQMTVSSGSADDDAGGTGALTVRIFGLDANYAEIQEDITLTGQTAVTTANSYLRVFRMMVVTAGSGLQNAGVLYTGTGAITDGVPANVFACIRAAENQSHMGLWTVPAAKTAHLVGLEVTTGGGTKFMTCRLVRRPLDEVFQPNLKFIVIQTGGPYVLDTTLVPLTYAAKTDVEMRAKSDQGTQDLSVAMCFILVED